MLHGVMEVASGFKLTADSSFEFFFSYGALDRTGKGKWSVHNDRLVLNSEPWKGSDFKFLDGRKSTQPGYSIEIVEKNKMILPYFDCVLKKGVQVEQKTVSQEGMAFFPHQAGVSFVPDSILLVFQFSPERYSAFPVTDKTQNQFRFSIEPWLFDYFFKDFVLVPSADGKSLSGQHPLLEPKMYSFTRE